MKHQAISKIFSLLTGISLVFAGALPTLAAGVLDDGSASLYFEPTTYTVAPGATFDVPVMVNVNAGSTTDTTVGVDAWVTFDNTKLEYVHPSANAGMPSDFSLGNGSVIITRSSTNSAIQANEIVISGLISAGGAPVNGIKKVGTLKFKVKDAATVGSTATLGFKFSTTNYDDTTSDSNVAPPSTSTKIDLLKTVGTATVTIAAASVNDPTITSVTPNSGSKDNSQLVTIVGTNFGTTQGTVKVNTSTSATVSSWSDASITATIPSWPSLTQQTVVPVTITRPDTKSATKTDGYTYTIGTPSPPPVPPSSTDPRITYIYPASGNKLTPTEVTIYGENFGYFESTDKNKVFVGLQLATIKDWSPSRVLIQVPPAPDLTSRTTLSVKLYRADGKVAEYIGFTYNTGPLPGTGPDEWMWGGIAAAAAALAWLTYRKLATRRMSA
ncbi:MAG: IPT/TIG domain-containing protein [bacterium]